MASSDAQQTLPSNGHVHVPEAVCDVEHEDEQVRSAEPEAELPASQSAAPEKHKRPTTSPTKRLPPVHTTTKGTSGPPTPQVKKVHIFRSALSFVTLPHMHPPHGRS